MSDSDGLFPATELEYVHRVVDDGVEAGAGVNKRFRAFEPAPVMLVPPSLDEWLPQNHLSRFIADIVETQLDLKKFYASYAKSKSQPPYDPRLMVRVLLYGYCVGVRSSRELERVCVDVVAFRWLAAQQAPELARRESRLVKLDEARAALEADAAARARKEAEKKARDKGDDDDTAAQKGDDAAKNAVVAAKAQRNFTDPDSRIMKTADGSFHYSYNAQAIVDADHQVIVATTLTNIAVDIEQVVPMVEKLHATMGVLPRQILADAGYCSAANLDYATSLKASSDGRTEFFIATGRVKHGEHVPEVPRGRIPANATLRERMARKLKTKKGRAVYARRKAIVEPVFGQIHTRQGKFVLLRGLGQAAHEWDLIAACHNPMKLHTMQTKALLAAPSTPTAQTAT